MPAPPPVEPVTREAPPLRGRIISTQRWEQLTFLHWAVDPARVAPLLPPGTRPDVFDGRTYVGLVPFRMVGVGVGRGPGVPYFGTFLETNVRLYSVDSTGRRGVVFLAWLLVAVVPVAFISLKPAYGSFRAWRAERLTVAAEQMIAAGRWDEALNKASAAYGLASRAPRTVRLVATILEHFQSDHALEEPTSLNAIGLLPRLAGMGVSAIKIEGRQRSPAYVTQVVSTLRAALDSAHADPNRYSPRPEWNAMLARHAEGSQVTQGAFERPWK